MSTKKNTKQTKILLVGAGKGGTALLKIFSNDPSIHIIAVVDVNPDAPGIILAKKMGLKISKYPNIFLEDETISIDVVIDVTANTKNQEIIRKLKSSETRMISGKAAKFLWTLIDVQRDKKILQKKYNKLKASLSENPNEEIIFGANPQMVQIKQMIYQVAATPATVLIVGETGTGKEIIASSILQLSHLKNEPFIKINCTAFTPTLLESELFGYKKGAFTGALKDKIGLLEKGDGGTIFLDEIGDVSLDMQVKLLRFLQFGEIRPVGSTETKIINTRIIAATNQNLEKLIKKKKFRKDLFYRLNSFVLELPSLRKRKEDIPVLAYHFLKLAVLKMNKKVETLSSKSLQFLNEYNYPGNLRELQSIIERAVILCNGNTIKPSHLPLLVQSTKTNYDYKKGLIDSRKKIVNQFERQALQHYLIQAKGNRTEAAMSARMPRRTFYRLLEKHNISKTTYKTIKQTKK